MPTPAMMYRRVFLGGSRTMSTVPYIWKGYASLASQANPFVYRYLTSPSAASLPRNLRSDGMKNPIFGQRGTAEGLKRAVTGRATLQCRT